MKASALIKDYPSVTAVTIGVGVVLHRVLYDSVHWFPDVAGAMSNFSEAWSIYLGFAGVLAIVSGFAGVVIVFAMTPGSDRLARLRRHGGERLEANWASPVRSALFASFTSATCAVIFVSGQTRLSWWIFEFVALLAITAGIRLTWLLTTLMSVVRAEDDQPREARHLKPTTVAELKKPRSKTG